MSHRFLRLASLGLVGLLLLPFAALAADPAPVSARIDFSPLVNEVLMPLAVALGGVLAAWISARIAAWFKLSDDERVRKLLEGAIQNGIALAQSRLAGVPMGFDVKNKVIADTVNYVIKATPDALKRFGIDPQTLAEKIEARIAVKEQAPPSATVIVAPPAPGAAS